MRRTQGAAEVQKEVTAAPAAMGRLPVLQSFSASHKKKGKKKNTARCAACTEAQQVSGLMHGMLGNYGTVDRDQFLFLLLWKSLMDSLAFRLFAIRWFIKVMVPILKRYILKVPYDSQFTASRFLYHDARATCQRASQARKQLCPLLLFMTTFAPEKNHTSLEIISDVTKGWVTASWLQRFHAFPFLTCIRPNKRKQLLL